MQVCLHVCMHIYNMVFVFTCIVENRLTCVYTYFTHGYKLYTNKYLYMYASCLAGTGCALSLG